MRIASGAHQHSKVAWPRFPSEGHGAYRVRYSALDVCRKEAFEQVRDRIATAWGSTDIVVNNAGYAKRTPVDEISVEEFDDIVAINMRSVFLSCQVFSRHMRANGYGRIVNVTSLAGQNGGTVASAHYAAAKAGAIMLS
ncbi:MAG TPA: SDR family oxidoreductase, partial [Variovorax sp.]